MGARSFVYGLVLLVLAVVAAGYATAWFQREPCIDATWADITARGVVGHRLGGIDEAIKRTDIEARVIWPYRVEVSYLVPEGLEGTVHVRDYTVLPWKRTLRAQAEHRFESL
jgi:hypothetical protein